MGQLRLNDEDSKLLAANIKRLVEENTYYNNQTQIAAGAGVTVSQLRQWMKGTSKPLARNLRALANCLGVDVSKFFSKE